MAKRKRAMVEIGRPDKGWAAKEDLHTLKRADEIRRDKGRMKAASAVAKKELETLHSLPGIDTKGSVKLKKPHGLKSRKVK